MPSNWKFKRFVFLRKKGVSHFLLILMFSLVSIADRDGKSSVRLIARQIIPLLF